MLKQTERLKADIKNLVALNISKSFFISDASHVNEKINTMTDDEIAIRYGYELGVSEDTVRNIISIIKRNDG